MSRSLFPFVVSILGGRFTQVLLYIIKGLSKGICTCYVLQSLKIVFISVNSADPDKMTHCRYSTNRFTYGST